MSRDIINHVTIHNLADERKHIEEVSVWQWEEWSKNSGAKLEDVVYRTKHSICKDRIPQMYIAKYMDEVIGTVSVWNNDLTARQDLLPWLAALYIKKEYRGIGVGTLLQDKCIEVVREFGYKSLYLITDHENYYEKSGWEFMEMVPLKDRMIRLYEYNIKD